MNIFRNREWYEVLKDCLRGGKYYSKGKYVSFPIGTAVDPDNFGEVSVRQVMNSLAELDANKSQVYVDPTEGLLTYRAPNSEYVTMEVDLTGFTNHEDSIISINETTLEFSISPKNTHYEYIHNGVQYTVSSEKTLNVERTTGIHFIYFDGSELKQSTETGDYLMTDVVFVASVYWNNDTQQVVLFGDERHGWVMSSAAHAYLHHPVGAALESGGQLSFNTRPGGGQEKSIRVAIEPLVLRDEDLIFSRSAKAEEEYIDVLAISGPENSPVWYKKDISPAIVGAEPAGHRAKYSKVVNGQWTDVEVEEDDYFVLAHLVATNDARRGVCVIQGQASYETKYRAKKGAKAELDTLVTTGLPVQEFVFLGTVILKTNSTYANSGRAQVVAYSNTVDYIDYRASFVGRSNAGVAVYEHNKFADLQGGDEDREEYYHLTEQQYLDLLDLLY